MPPSTETNIIPTINHNPRDIRKTNPVRPEKNEPKEREANNTQAKDMKNQAPSELRSRKNSGRVARKSRKTAGQLIASCVDRPVGWDGPRETHVAVLAGAGEMSRGTERRR